jgi:hypothetical protein
MPGNEPKLGARCRARIAAILLLALAGCGGVDRAPQGSGPAGTAATNAAAPPAARDKAAAPAASGPYLRADGYDTIRIGAPPAAAAGYALADDGSYDDVCRIYSSPRLPGVYLIVENGLVMRITAHADPGETPATLRTDRGIGVGSTEAEVRAAYAPLREQPHHYVAAPAKDLFFGGEGASPGLRFEMGEDGRVSALHAGRPPVLEYAEACS